MPLTDQQLIDLAGAVLDGEAIDWDAAESRADPADRALVRHLRLVSSVAASQQPPLPDQWGPLRLLERVGSGAFGDVFRAWDTRLDREVALKLIPVPAGASGDRQGSIIREGQLLARVRHPNVVTIYGAEQIGDRIGLWMEFVRGKTLEDELRESGPFAPGAVVDAGGEVCRAVSAVHRAGLLHRDIKAQNVMRSDDGRIVLMDFGAGGELVAGAAPDRTGTPLYVAPEVLDGGAATVRSDVYSVGVLLYHLATRLYPVAGRTLHDVRVAHARDERIGIRTVQPGLARPLVRVVERAIDPQPERRQESAEALLDDLVAIQRGPARKVLRFGLALAAALLLIVLGSGGTDRNAVQGQPQAAASQAPDGIDAETYQLYLRARTLRDERGERIRAAVPLFQEVIRKAPDFARAEAALAAAYGYLAANYPTVGANTIPPREAEALIEPLAHRALEADPSLAEAHAANGFVHAFRQRWQDAEASFRHAIELEPTLPSLYGDFVISTLLPWGRLDESLAVLRRGLAANPHSLDVRRVLIRVQINARQYDEAIANCKLVLDANPTMPYVRFFNAWALLLKGERAEALKRIEAMSAGLPGMRGYIHAIRGERAEAEAIAAQFAHLPQRQAEIHGLLGDRDRAFEALERLAAINPVRAAAELSRPELGLGDDPRIAALRATLGFTR